MTKKDKKIALGLGALGIFASPILVIAVLGWVKMWKDILGL